MQEAERDPHDGGLVQVGGDSAGEGQHMGEFVKHLRLLTPPTSGRIAGTQLPLLRTGPEGEEGGRKKRMMRRRRTKSRGEKEHKKER